MDKGKKKSSDGPRGIAVYFGAEDSNEVSVAVYSKGVNATDAFIAVAAILEPIVKQRPEIGCRSIASLIALSDYRVCDACTHDGPCALLTAMDSHDNEAEEH